MHLGHGDWLWFHFIWDSARKTYIDYHQIPWWNPYYCGGNFGVANPQAFSLSPLFLILLPFPTALAMKLYLNIQTFLGLWGMYELARRFYGGGVSAIVAAIFVSCSGYMGWHMNGQTGMANLHQLAWVVYFYLRGRNHWPWALGTGAVLAFMLQTSGLYPTVISSLAIVGHALVVFLGRNWKETFAYLKSGIIACGATIAYSAVKLLPMVDFLKDHRRPIPLDDGIRFPVLVDALLVKRTTATQIWPHIGYKYAWWGEYSNYIGWIGIAIAAVAIWKAIGSKRKERWIVLIFLGILIGDHGSYSPYAILRTMPMMQNLRVPTRYWIVFDVWLACLIAAAFHQIVREIVRKYKAVWAWLALAGILTAFSAFTVDVVRSNGIAIMAGAMPTAPAPKNNSERTFHQVWGSAAAMFLFPPQNLGTLHCFDELHVDLSHSLQANLPSEVYLRDRSAGTVQVTSFSPSSWEVNVSVKKATTVVLNQNGFRGWRSNVGNVHFNKGLVNVDVPAGNHQLRIWYRPQGYWLGSTITLGALLLSFAGLVWQARKKWLHADGNLRKDQTSPRSP
jgi:hypothetical protein